MTAGAQSLLFSRETITRSQAPSKNSIPSAAVPFSPPLTLPFLSVTGGSQSKGRNVAPFEGPTTPSLEWGPGWFYIVVSRSPKKDNTPPGFGTIKLHGNKLQYNCNMQYQYDIAKHQQYCNSYCKIPKYCNIYWKIILVLQ